MDHYEKARRKLLLHALEADRLRQRLIATLVAVGAPEERIERVRRSGELWQGRFAPPAESS
ncbi:MAG: hypothetical protein AB1941_16935 [Gemmatimonadota bacterium]